jgi:hypothetical protein
MYRDYSTEELIAFCSAKEQNEDPVPVDLIAELGERGIICASRISSRELVFVKNDTVRELIAQ